MLEAQAKELVTGPTGEVVTLAEMKLHLRIDHNEEDGLLATYIAAVQEDVEGVAGTPLLSQVWLAKYRCWSTFLLPHRPISAVGSVKYREADGTLQTVDPSVYTVELASNPCFVTNAYSRLWPTTELRPGLPIEITFTCGWSAGALPKRWKAAIMIGVEKLHYIAQKDVGVGTATDAYLRQLDRSYYNLIGREIANGVAL